MMREVLKVSGVGKSYAVYGANLTRFARWFGAPLKPKSEFWALRDINISLKSGEAVALIGQNGAGKSTLLKLVTGTVRPSEGTIEVGGRISAILELGLGFNPEFTGRENVRHSGGLIGLSPTEITELIPSIEAFAEIGEFFDQPVRVYSSGMQARLAFALATAVRPEILIVDEILSVGDSYFQHKSFARIREFREKGTSILLVTHSMGDVIELCDRVYLISDGRVVREGAPDEVVDFYNAMIAEKENSRLSIEQRRQENGWSVTRSGDFRALVRKIELVSTSTGDAVSTAFVGDSLTLKMLVEANADLPRLVLGVMIRDRTGHVVWGSNTWHTKQAVEDVTAGERLHYSLRFDCSLGPGSYSVSPALVSSSTHLDDNYEWTDNLIVFDVVNGGEAFFIGSTHLKASFDVTREVA